MPLVPIGPAFGPVDMAEVSLRLFRSRARQHLYIEEHIPGSRKQGGWLPPSCVACRVTVACTPEASHRQGLNGVWPSGAPRTHFTWVNGRQGSRFFSQWASSRASYHQTGGRRSGSSNGTQDPVPPLYKSRTAYYDILDVSGNATQSQIKTAYYKQSFRFHPDRNGGDEDAARRFGLVTEAYHILGSISLRKKYDHGILGLDDVHRAKKPNGKGDRSTHKEATGKREAPGTSSSKTPTKPLFDFDAFYQAHYGEQLARERSWKERREHIEKMKAQQKLSTQLNKLGEFTVVLLFVSATILLMSFK